MAQGCYGGGTAGKKCAGIVVSVLAFNFEDPGSNLPVGNLTGLGKHVKNSILISVLVEAATHHVLFLINS